MQFFFPLVYHVCFRNYQIMKKYQHFLVEAWDLAIQKVVIRQRMYQVHYHFPQVFFPNTFLQLKVCVIVSNSGQFMVYGRCLLSIFSILKLFLCSALVKILIHKSIQRIVASDPNHAYFNKHFLHNESLQNMTF